MSCLFLLLSVALGWEYSPLLVVTEGEEWSYPLEVQEPNPESGYQVEIANITEMRIEDTYSFRLTQNYHYPSDSGCSTPLSFTTDSGDRVILTCHSNMLQAVKLQPSGLVWEVAISEASSRILKVEAIKLRSMILVFCLVQEGTDVQLFRLVVENVEAAPGPPKLVEVPAGTPSGLTDIAILHQTLFVSSTSQLCLFTLLLSIPPELRICYGALPGRSRFLPIRSLFPWSTQLFLVIEDALLLSYSFLNSTLSPLHSYNFEAYGVITTLQPPPRKPYTLTVSTTKGLLLVSCLSLSLERWFPGEVLSAFVLDKVLLSIQAGTMHFEVYNLRLNRTEKSWPVVGTSLHFIDDPASNHYELLVTNSRLLQLYSLSLGYRMLYGKFSTPGKYHGYIQGAEMTSLSVEVMSSKNSTILYGNDYNLRNSTTTVYTVKQGKITFSVEWLFSGPAVEIEIIFGRERRKIPKCHEEFSIPVDLPSEYVLEVTADDLLVFRSHSEVRVFQQTSSSLVPLSTFPTPGLQALAIYTHSLFTFYISDRGAYISQYDVYQGYVTTVAVSFTCSKLRARALWVMCVGQDEIQLFSFALSTTMVIRADFLGVQTVNFIDVAVILHANDFVLIVACAINGIFTINMRNSEVEWRLPPVVNLTAVHYDYDKIVMIDSEGRIGLYESNPLTFHHLRTLPAWETGAPHSISTSPYFILTRKSEKIYIYRLRETVHNSLFEVANVEKDCSYLLSEKQLLKYCTGTNLLQKVSLGQDYLTYPLQVAVDIDDRQEEVTIQASNYLGSTATLPVALIKSQN